MRRIGTEKERARKEKRSRILVGAFMLALLIFSTVGFGLYYSSSGSSSGVQNNADTNPSPWSLDISGNRVYFLNSKDSVSDININAFKDLSNYAGNALYIDSESEEITQEIANTIGLYSSRVQRACYGICEDDYPEKDCTENLIVYEYSQEDSIVQEDNCVFIEGDIKTVDAFLYSVFEGY